MSIVSSKSCTRCSEMKPLTEYYKKAIAKDGLRPDCKICVDGASAKYYAKNREAVDAYRREYLAKNKESVAAVQRAYREKNKEARNAYSREYHEGNKEDRNAYNREYSKNNRAVCNELARRRKARRLENGFEKYTEAEALELYGIDCHLCMEPIDMDAPRGVGIPGWERGLHFDHVIALVNGGPDNLENIRPSHGICNLRKNRY